MGMQRSRPRLIYLLLHFSPSPSALPLFHLSPWRILCLARFSRAGTRDNLIVNNSIFFKLFDFAPHVFQLITESEIDSADHVRALCEAR